MPWGCVAARTGKDTCERPKVTPGAHVRCAAAAGTAPARVPTSCCCPHLPGFAVVPRLQLLPGPPLTPGRGGESQGYARDSAAWGSGTVGGHGRQVHQVYRCTGPRGRRNTAVADRFPTRPTRPAPATPVRLYRPERGGPFILFIRLCHRLGLRGPDSEFSKVAAEPASGAASGM